MTATQTQLTELERIARDVFARLGAAADEFEAYRHPHAERLVRLADELAQTFGLGRSDRASLRIAALAHDLGEAAMRRDYIRRAGALTEEERLDMMRHPVIGEQEAARAGADRGAQLLVRWHHEWWNGAGYPDALRGTQIPLAARILRVADAYAALTDARPWRNALSEADARQHLIVWAGLEFDPQVVRAFLTLRDLPELRSYALLERETPRAPEVVAPGSEQTDDAPVFGAVPEAGENPHVAAPHAPAAPAQADEQAAHAHAEGEVAR